jgi:hypothetical protein
LPARAVNGVPNAAWLAARAISAVMTNSTATGV